ncbi:tyrosine-type recombinase/integrase [Lutibacter sp.]|uniref:tyrosine-type recombinase/integrase n=1 Tax=Lutibacter sp. TaxID=1925666 RepID=UPI0035643E2B
MASIKYLLRNKSTTNETSISLKVLLPEKKDLVYSTGLKVAPRNWDFKNQKVRSKVEVEAVKAIINHKLTKIYSFVDEAYLKLQVANKLTKENLKYELDVYFNKVTEEKKIETFYEYVDVLIENSKKRVAKVTWQTYSRTLELIKDFDKSENYKIDFKSINIDFYFSFVEYLEDVEEMSPNTIGKQIKNLKMFMNSANEDGITDLMGHKHKHFKVLKEDSFQIYLNEDELLELSKLEYELDSVEDRVRDLFLMGAYTGQRVSDWRKLNENNISVYDGVSCFKLTQTKTNNEVIIPIHPVIQSIFDKRGGVAPKFVNEQDVNLKLKKIAEKAKIKDKVSEKENIPKYDLVSTHTARRSFCTNAYKNGMDTLAIMQLSGHKTEKSFLTYIKIGKEEFAKRIANHKFFKSE